MGIQPKMLDPDPDQMNMDPKHWFLLKTYVNDHPDLHNFAGFGSSLKSSWIQNPTDQYEEYLKE